MDTLMGQVTQRGEGGSRIPGMEKKMMANRERGSFSRRILAAPRGTEPLGKFAVEGEVGGYEGE